MKTIFDVNGFEITESEITEITREIIKILSQKNITHAMAYMILDETKKELQNTVVKMNV